MNEDFFSNGEHRNPLRRNDEENQETKNNRNNTDNMGNTDDTGEIEIDLFEELKAEGEKKAKGESEGEATDENGTTTGFIIVEPSGENGEGDKESPFRRAQEQELDANRQFYSAFASMNKKTKKRRVVAGILAVVLCFTAGFGGAATAIYFGQSTGLFTIKNAITITPDDTPERGVAIAEKVIPSVVGISTQTRQDVNMNMFFGKEQIVAGIGTGIIVDEDGYILTNSHVVNDGDTVSITVQLTDGREVPGTVLWNDSNIDIAVVKVDVTGLTAAELGDSDEMKIGSYVAAIGNPLGMNFDRSMSQGIISGLNRTITVTNTSGSSQTTMEGLMQTDASINSGNSGGPLLNSTGQVIGINTAKASGGEGIGFAIPINNVKSILEQVRESGTYRKAFIGITGVSAGDAPLYNINPDINYGAVVLEIVAGSPAEEAGIKTEDVIIAMDGERIDTISELTNRLYNYNPGDTVELKVFRNGDTLTIDVVLTEKTE